MALPIESSIENLIKTLEALGKQPENKMFQTLKMDALLSAVHFHVAKGREPVSSSLDLQSGPVGSYLGVCNSSARARMHGRHESSLWYGAENNCVNFVALIRPGKFLRSEASAIESGVILVGCSDEQRRLKKPLRNAYVLTADGSLFRFFRLTVDGKTCEIQWQGSDYKDLILSVVTIFEDALLSVSDKSTSLTGPKQNLDTGNLLNDEIVLNGRERTREMTVRVAVKILMDVIKKLPIPLEDNEERNVIRQIELVIAKALFSYSKTLEDSEQYLNADPFKAMLQMFDIKLTKVLKEFEFEDYHADSEVLKKAIRKETLREIMPFLNELDNQVRDRRLKRIFE